MICLLELKGYDSIEKSLFFSSHSIAPFYGTDADRPNQHYEPRIQSIGRFASFMFGSGRTSGQSSTSAGVFSLTNPDGGLDYLQDWAFAGREICVYKGEEGMAFAEFSLALKGTLKQPAFNVNNNDSSVDFVARDRRSELDKPIQTTLYLGTNSGMTGNEGLPGDISGTPKPQCFGKCFNITPITCNTSALRYQVNSRSIQAVNAVYDKGIALVYVPGTPAAGEYTADLSTGIITLGSSPSGVVTCDCEGDNAAGYLSSVADLIKEISLTYGDIVMGDIDTASISALNTKNSSAVGIFINTETSISAVFDELAASIGAYWLFNPNGKLTVGRLEAPSGTAVHVIDDGTIEEIARIQSNDEDKGVPSYQFKLHYRNNFTVQDAGNLAGAVSDQRRAELAQETRTITVTDNSIKTVHLLSPVIARHTLLATEANAQTEADRLHVLYKVRRYFYRLVLPDLAEFSGLGLGDEITLIYPRWGLDAGVNFIITGISRDTPNVNQIQVEVWG